MLQFLEHGGNRAQRPRWTATRVMAPITVIRRAAPPMSTTMRSIGAGCGGFERFRGPARVSA